MFAYVVVDFSGVELLECLGVRYDVVLGFVCGMLRNKGPAHLVPKGELLIEQHRHLFLDPKIMPSLTREFLLNKTYDRVIIPITQRQMILRKTLRDQNLEAELKLVQKQDLL